MVLYQKSLISLAAVLLASIAAFAMFEMFGRTERRYHPNILKAVHKTAGVFYAVVFLYLSYNCILLILNSKAELSARGTFHALLAFALAVMFLIKVLAVRVYRKYYDYAKVVGLSMFLLTLGTAGTSAGYYLLVSEFGSVPVLDMAAGQGGAGAGGSAISTNAESIKKGKELYDSKCYFCHDPLSNDTVVGPGHKNIMKNPMLPISGKPSTPEHIINQIRKPVDKMPSFDYLTDEEIAYIIAYMNTL